MKDEDFKEEEEVKEQNKKEQERGVFICVYICVWKKKKTKIVCVGRKMWSDSQ